MADGAPEIPEAFRRADQLVRELTADPELGARVRARVKEKFPDVGFVEDRIDPALSAMQARLDEQAAKAKALEDALAERDQKAVDAERASKFTAELDAAKEKYRLTPEGFDMAVERMRATNSYDADAAAAWAAMQNPVVKEPSKAYLGPQNANFFGSEEKDANWELLHKNPDRFVDNELRQFLTDPDAYVREAGFG